MPDDRQWSIGTQLKRWRRQAGLTAAEAAASLDVSQQTISNWEVNASKPHVSRSAKIEKLYALDRGMVAALLTGDEPPPGAPDPDVMGIVDGQLVWSERRAVIPYDEIANPDETPAVERAIARDYSLTDDGREALVNLYRILSTDPRATRKQPLRPQGVEPEPEGP